jgi:hypothetical protein
MSIHDKEPSDPHRRAVTTLPRTSVVPVDMQPLVVSPNAWMWNPCLPGLNPLTSPSTLVGPVRTSEFSSVHPQAQHINVLAKSLETTDMPSRPVTRPVTKRWHRFSKTGGTSNQRTASCRDLSPKIPSSLVHIYKAHTI